jgi:RNA polymerase sigma-70 factor, ECF subfamily
VSARGVQRALSHQATGMREEDALVQRARGGDVTAFRALFLGHRGAVARLVYRMLGSSPDLEDVVQEVFVQVWKSLPSFRGQSKLTTWIHRVAVNVVFMHRRAARTRLRLVEHTTEPEERVDEAAVAPDDDADRRARLRAFSRLLARLSDKKRVVFVLHELEGITPGEISEIVGAPVLTVRTRLFYARRELRSMMDDEPALAALTRTHEAAGTPRRRCR